MASVSAADALQKVEDLIARGQLAEAEKVVRRIVATVPDYSAAQFALGDILERTERADEALKVYEDISTHHPGMGLSFSRRAMLLLRRQFGAPPPPRARKAGPAVSCGKLGFSGRFANQLLQYAVTRLYAERHGIEAEFPDWIGRDLYLIDDPVVSAVLPSVTEQDTDIMAAVAGDPATALAGRDFQGFFCGHTGPLNTLRAQARAFFRPRPAIAARLEEWRRTLPPHGTLVALHLRRGDFVGHDQFWIAPVAWYLAWLETAWPELDRPLLYIATDDPALVATFARYSPITAADLGRPLAGAEFLSDFHILTQADRLAISNSTFSFVAAMLNENASHFLRPEKDAGRLAVFDPWNAPVLLNHG